MKNRRDVRRFHSGNRGGGSMPREIVAARCAPNVAHRAIKLAPHRANRHARLSPLRKRPRVAPQTVKRIFLHPRMRRAGRIFRGETRSFEFWGEKSGTRKTGWGLSTKKVAQKLPLKN
ncbi:MAG: hypothetical protein HYV95_06305 [Opitutae bacterium]|nr:hypothetical protein [Opitutae bacterium]